MAKAKAKAEIATQGEAALEVSKNAIVSEEKVSAQDILIPKLLLMQGLSELVTSGEATIGEFVCTTSKEVFGNYEKSFTVVPFYIHKKWIEYEIIKTRNGTDKKFSQMIPIVTDPAAPGFNDNLPLLEDDIERVRVFDLYCLIPSEVEMGLAFPYVIPFQKTSMDAGRTAYTQMYIRNGANGLSYAALDISAKTKQNDHGTFGVPAVKLARKSTELEMEAAAHWYKAVVGGQTKLDDSDLTPKESTQEVTPENAPY